mmetsp:Transcript_11973/g.38064  ORF Transcript_11973/g.38064 Transcript_11973/m.38064 type:complete len:284 (-) Transcript_11973:233-1084(-)
MVASFARSRAREPWGGDHGWQQRTAAPPLLAPTSTLLLLSARGGRSFAPAVPDLLRGVKLRVPGGGLAEAASEEAVDGDGRRRVVRRESPVVLEVVRRRHKKPRHEPGGGVGQLWRVDQEVVERDHSDGEEHRHAIGPEELRSHHERQHVSQRVLRQADRVGRHGHDDAVEAVVEAVRPVHCARVHPAVRAVVADRVADDDGKDHRDASGRREGLRHPAVGDELVQRRPEDGIVDNVAEDALRVERAAALPLANLSHLVHRHQLEKCRQDQRRPRHQPAVVGH